MTIRVAINGFGRIGRNFARAVHGNDQIELVAANDLGDVATLAHLLKYDTVHGRAPFEIKHDDQGLAVDGRCVSMISSGSTTDAGDFLTLTYQSVDMITNGSN